MYLNYYLPPMELSNNELESYFNDPKWTAQKIFKKTGIHTRHVVKDELISDLAVKVVEDLLEECGFDKSSIDFLLLCTQSPDYYIPPTACIVQDRLGLPQSIGALDFNLGCSGYIYGLALAKGLLLAGLSSRLLLVTSETYSKRIHPKDRSTRTIFGDAAAATMLNKDDICNIGEFVFGTDGAGAKDLIVPSGGMASPCSERTKKEQIDESGNARTMENLFMNGPEIFAFTLREIPRLIDLTLKKNNLDISGIDLFVFHQANRFILETLRDKIGIPQDKFFINMELTGNTVSASIPIALRQAIDSNKIVGGKKVLLAGFGVGYSWGATVLSF